MPIQFKFFTIPTIGSQDSEIELNKFLRSVKIVHVKKQCITLNDHAYWSIMVEYMDSKNKSESKPQETNSGNNKQRIDYKEVLSPDDFTLFVQLREWRKETAAKEAVPVYTIFTNEQLARIAEKKIQTTSALQEISGIGDARIKKYGNAVINLVSQNATKRKV